MKLLMVILVVWLYTQGGAIAQNPNEYSISGLVLDPSLSLVQGARVSIHSLNRDTVMEGKTDETGKFHFVVRPDTYSISVEAKDFLKSEKTITVSSTGNTPLRFVLTLGEVKEQIEVDADNSVNTDSGNNQDQVHISRSQLDRLPISGTGYAATLEQLLDPSAVGTNGPAILVNGMSMGKTTVPASNIEEIRVDEDPYSARYSQPGWGRINIITKAAAKDYHASLGFGIGDSEFDARDAFALVRPPERSTNIDGSFSGPIRKNRDSILFSFNRSTEDLTSAIYAQEPSGIVRENVPNPSQGNWWNLNYSSEFGAGQSFSVQYERATFRNNNQGVGGLVLPEAGSNLSASQDSFVLTQRSPISPNLLNQFQLRLERNWNQITSLNAARQIVVEGAFTSGGAQADRLDTEYNLRFNDDVSWIKGKHQLSFGVSIPTLSREALDNHVNSAGTFSFANLQAYSMGQPFSFTWQQGNPRAIFFYEEMGVYAQDQIRLTDHLSITTGIRYDWQSQINSSKSFGPRVSFAYAMGNARETILRGGLGIFHDLSGASAITDLFQYDGHHLQQFTLQNPNFPDPGTTTDKIAAPVNIVELNPRTQVPRAFHYGLGVEHAISHRTTVFINYHGSRGAHLFRSFDLNAPPPPDYSQPPNPNFGIVRQIQSPSRQTGNSITAGLRGNLSKYLSLQSRYVLSSTHNDTSGITYFPPNSYDLADEWGRADFDRRHTFQLLSELHMGRWLDVGAMAWAATGRPYNVTTGGDDFHTGLGNARPPDVPRNSGQGLGYAIVDLRLSKQVSLTARKEKGPIMTLAADAFNVQNHVNYTTFVGVVTSPFFGKPVSSYPARKLQFTLRMSF